MEPAPEVLAAMETVGAVLAWVPMNEALRGTFCACLEIEEGDPIRSLAAIDKDDLLAARGNMKVAESPLGPTAKGKVVTAWTVARIRTGLEKSAAQRAEDTQLVKAAAAQKMEVLKQQADALKKETSISRASTCDSLCVVSLSETVDQTISGTVALLSDEEIRKAHGRFTAITEGKCPKEERPTDQQLTAVAHILKEMINNAYVDLAIYGPFQNRLRRKLMMMGLVPTGDGQFKRVELRGPPDLATWVAAFMVLRATLIMLNAVSMSALDKYLKKVIKLHQEYGSKCWHLLYQAETRMRQEEMPAMRRDILDEVDAVKKANGVHPYDPQRPWALVWTRATEQIAEKFWSDEFEKPATSVRLELRRLGEVVDGDAPVQSVGESVSSGGPKAVVIGPPSVPAPPQGGLKRTAEESNGAWPWPFWTNKRHKQLCRGYQTGQCHSAGRHNLVCPVNSAERHQCAKCLGEHPANSNLCNSPGYQHDDGPQPKGGRGGKGGGKGRGRGKGGKNGGKNSNRKWQNGGGWNSWGNEW